MDISIVIPTFNRFELLGETLGPLLNQRTSARYEVIFVSNGSTDRSCELLERMARQHSHMRYYWIEPTGGPSAPRNLGIRHSRGEAIIILDNDVLPHTDLVEQHWRYHCEHPEPEAAALGKVEVPPRLLDDPMSLFHSFPYYEVEKQARLDYLHFWTCNVSFKRRFMLEHGMFPEDMLYFEDVICGHRLAQHGMYLRYLPSAYGEHLHNMKPASVAEKGRFTGWWLYRCCVSLGDVAFDRRFGIFNPAVGWTFLLWKLAKRVGFRATDNAVVRSALEFAGGAGPRRSRATDFYYYLIFRRNMLAGYAQAKREHAATGFQPIRMAVNERLDLDRRLAVPADRKG